MRPTSDDNDAVSVRFEKKKKSNEKANVNFEPEKYEAALRNILGKNCIIIKQQIILFYSLL